MVSVPLVTRQVTMVVQDRPSRAETKAGRGREGRPAGRAGETAAQRDRAARGEQREDQPGDDDAEDGAEERIGDHHAEHHVGPVARFHADEDVTDRVAADGVRDLGGCQPRESTTAVVRPAGVA